MPLNKFWDFWDNIQIKHFLFLIVTSLSVLVVGIVGKLVVVDLLVLGEYTLVVNAFHWCFIGVGIFLALLSIGALFAILDIV